MRLDKQMTCHSCQLLFDTREETLRYHEWGRYFAKYLPLPGILALFFLLLLQHAI
jgi:hypothetical protein